MIKMNPLVVPITILAILSAANADVSHLHNYNQNAQNGRNGYQYNNLGLTSNLGLHTPESNPAPTQYFGTYGDTNTVNQLPTSYSPQPSGSPFGSVAPLPRTYLAPATPAALPSSRLSVPLQSPVVNQQRFQTNFQNHPNYQQYQQSRAIEVPSYQTQTQTQAFGNAFNNAQTRSQAYTQQSQEPIITKHFYVHAAPEDPEEDAGPRFVQVGRPQKNYKIIFIKPPSYGLKSQIIPVLPRVEDKTIVYVLSKKPTFDQNIQIPEPAPTEPSKPDVFFIKYKTKEEAEQAQQSIQAAYDQANLAGNENVDHIAARFGASGGSGSSAFGGQDSFAQQNYQRNVNGGQYTSTTRTKRNIA